MPCKQFECRFREIKVQKGEILYLCLPWEHWERKTIYGLIFHKITPRANTRKLSRNRCKAAGAEGAKWVSKLLWWCRQKVQSMAALNRNFLIKNLQHIKKNEADRDSKRKRESAKEGGTRRRNEDSRTLGHLCSCKSVWRKINRLRTCDLAL